jgi:hypothetical protein
MAPMKIMAQNTIDELGRSVPKDRLTHDQSWKWSSGTSVNSRDQKELLQACRYGFCIRQLVNWAVVAKRKHPHKCILASKIDFKSAYQQGTLHFKTALLTTMQLPEDKLAIITLCLTFGGAPCPFEWGILLEAIYNLANKLLKCKDWDPDALHASVLKEISAQEYLEDDIPFVIGWELIMNIPIYYQGYADAYINNTAGFTVGLPGTRNADQLEAAIPLTIKVAAQTNNKNEPIPHKPMVCKRQVESRRGIVRVKDNSGMAFQL